MNDRTLTPPSTVINEHELAVCAEGHYFNGRDFSLVCPCLNQGVWVKDGALAEHMREVEEEQERAEAAKKATMAGLVAMTLKAWDDEVQRAKGPVTFR